LTRAFDIVIPASEVTRPRDLNPKALSGKKIEWVSPAPEGYATYFTVVFTTAATTAGTSNWPGHNNGTRLIWRTDLPNTETVWLVAHERPVDDWVKQHLAAFKESAVPSARRRMEDAGYSDIEETRAAIYYRNEDSRMRFYIDVSCVGLLG
jgi:hypothetical protein